MTVAEEGSRGSHHRLCGLHGLRRAGDSRRGRYAAADCAPRMNRWRASSPTWCADDPRAPDAHGAAALGTKAQLVHRVACADPHPGSGRLPPGRRSNGSAADRVRRGNARRAGDRDRTSPDRAGVPARAPWVRRSKTERRSYLLTKPVARWRIVLVKIAVGRGEPRFVAGFAPGGAGVRNRPRGR